MGNETEDQPKEQVTGDRKTSLDPPPPPVVTRHEMALRDGLLHYEATFGLMPIKNEKGDIEATLSFTAYTAGKTEGGDRGRPLIFMFNGGPGSSSAWLHLGGIGPRRVSMQNDGAMPPPPFKVVDNEHTWLEFTDLVFVDPVDTGYSKAANEELTRKFLSVKGDLDLTGDFIRRYLRRFNRWSSPLLLGGESYGTFRSAGLAGTLIDKGVVFNGVILISSVLELGTLLFESGDDLPYALYPPSYTATAWYHQVLEPELQSRTLPELLAEVEEWSLGEYSVALARGSSLSPESRQQTIDALARYTGISAQLIDQWDLRIDGGRFCNELLRSKKLTVGRLDSRHTNFDPGASADKLVFDPSMSAIRPPFTAALNHYVLNELEFESDDEYQILRDLEWNWGDAADGAPRTTTQLQAAFANNPYLHVLVMSGYYDLATPFFATRYTIDRLKLDPRQRRQIQSIEYPGGHMIYLAADLMAQMRSDVETFVKNALNFENRPLAPGARNQS
ncbi:peptidase S10 [soil metagenome]